MGLGGRRSHRLKPLAVREAFHVVARRAVPLVVVAWKLSGHVKQSLNASRGARWSKLRLIETLVAVGCAHASATRTQSGKLDKKNCPLKAKLDRKIAP